jgi:hypothetical protein
LACFRVASNEIPPFSSYIFPAEKAYCIARIKTHGLPPPLFNCYHETRMMLTRRRLFVISPTKVEG